MMIIFLVLVIVGIYYLVNGLGRKARYNKGGFVGNLVSGAHTSSFDILKKRYASGEITRGEYEEMKETLLEEEEYYE